MRHTRPKLARAAGVAMIDAIAIKLRLRELYPNAVTPPWPADATYQPADPSWVSGKLFGAYRRLMFWAGLTRWKTTHDCDNKSRTFMCAALACWGAHAKPRDAESLCVGRISYKVDGRGWHSINVMLVGQEMRPVYIEPQGPRFVHLSESEVASVRFVEM